MPTKSSRLTFRWSTIGEALAEGLEDLATANYAEVEVFQERFPLDVNWPAYQMAERRGELKSVAARDGDKLVGYASYTLQPAAQHKTELWATNRSLYMSPDYRGYGSRELMQNAERLLKEIGVTLVIQAVKEPNSTSSKRRATLGDLLLRRGYAPYERHYAKVL